jgi:hypothetical protein
MFTVIEGGWKQGTEKSSIYFTKQNYRNQIKKNKLGEIFRMETFCETSFYGV